MKFTFKEQLFVTILLIAIFFLWFEQIEFLRALDFSAAVFPGWHTTLVPPGTLLLWLLFLILLIYTFIKAIYFLIRKNDR